MFRSVAIRAALLCLAVTPFFAAAQAQIKVGVISIQKALSDTDELKKESAAIEAKYKPRQDELNKIQADLQNLDTQLGSGKLSQQQAADLQAQGQKKQRDAQRISDDLQQDFEKDRQEVLTRTSQKMQDVVNKLAADKGLDVILEASQTLFVKPALDITAEATAAYNKANPAK
jgi:outer membrane protein